MEKTTIQKRKQGKVLDRVLLAAGIAFLCVFCITGYFLLRYYGEYRETKELNDRIAELRQAEAGGDNGGKSASQAADSPETDGGTIEKSLRMVNADYIGWITIPDTEIYYPVVQRDNAYYLSHDFTGEKNSHGAIFLDENCSFESGILLIHGHHMKDGTMFGGLKNYKKESFRREHGVIYLDRGEGDEAFEIFAAALIDLTEEGYFDYQELPAGEAERAAYLEKLRSSAFWYGDTEEPAGTILLLSTCEYGSSDERLVVAAVQKE